MPSFLDKAAESDKEIRKTQEKDPADLSGAKEPDWDNPDSWGSDGSDPDDSASGDAGDAPNRDGRQEQAPPAPPKQTSSPSSKRSRPARLPGRPRGPQRVPLTVRLLESTDRKLTEAVQQQQLNPQSIVEEALEAYFRRHKIKDPGADEGVA
ncbi:hypothetical protein ACF07L_38125 [Streptomyces anulatus]|uniref:hypothetical protein n=1 Tax=Streptomyces anulatus TaxID=1892 RepID=UPI0036F969CC